MSYCVFYDSATVYYENIDDIPEGVKCTECAPLEFSEDTISKYNDTKEIDPFEMLVDAIIA